MTSESRITTYSSREFNQDTGGAKRAAEKGAVYITDRGQPSHVLLSIDEYRRLTEPRRNIVDMIAMRGDEDIDFEPGRLEIGLKPVDFD